MEYFGIGAPLNLICMDDFHSIVELPNIEASLSRNISLLAGKTKGPDSDKGRRSYSFFEEVYVTTLSREIVNEKHNRREVLSSHRLDFGVNKKKKMFGATQLASQKLHNET